MHALDTEIEWFESQIAEWDDYDRFSRNAATGEWTEWNLTPARERGKLINRQAVLFAMKEGF